MVIHISTKGMTMKKHVILSAVIGIVWYFILSIPDEPKPIIKIKQPIAEAGYAPRIRPRLPREMPSILSIPELVPYPEDPLLPCPLPHECRVTSPYSLNRAHPTLAGVTRPHRAIDLACTTGTPIKTIADGVVTRVYRTKSGGLSMEITHAEQGIRVVMLHLQRAIFKTNSQLASNTTAATCGDSGSAATGPHLHLSILNMKTGQKIDPATMIQTRTAYASR